MVSKYYKSIKFSKEMHGLSLLLDGVGKGYKMKLSTFLALTNKEMVRPRVTCKDGFSISIQANKFAYCSPREDNAKNYSSVELGYPNTFDEIIEEYAEDTDFTKTVYGYVPVATVDKLLQKHGGVVFINFENQWKGLMSLESGISFSKEAKEAFASHECFFIRKKEGKALFINEDSLIPFWQTSIVKDVKKCENGYMCLTTASGHKYHLTTTAFYNK